MIIYIGTDHKGFRIKEKVKSWLLSWGHEVEDLGAHSLNPDDDYPDFVTPVAREVSQNKESSGVILGKTGEGEAVCANRVKGVRAVVYYGGNLDLLRLTREHNNANVLSLAGGFLQAEEAEEAVRVWLETPFSNEERHVRRLNKLDV